MNTVPIAIYDAGKEENRRQAALKHAVALILSPELTFSGKTNDVVIKAALRFEHYLRTGEYDLPKEETNEQ